jgi:hypothetical protein
MATEETTTAAEIEQEPSVTTATPESSTPGLSDIRSITENEEQMGLVRDYAPPILAIIASSLTWASVSAPFIGTVTISGFATDIGYLLSFFAVATMAAVYIEHSKARLIASGLAALSTVLGFLYLASEMSGGAGEAMVQTSYGMGLYLAIAASAAMVYVAYQEYSTVAE